MTTESLVALLLAKGKTVATAESCTGGLCGKLLTDVPGSSAVYPGGVVSYSDEVKHTVLGVPLALLDAHGAVSAPVAAAMAEGVRRLCRSDYAVSATGLAGPDGDGSGKPVGLVYIAVTDGSRTVVTEYHFSGARASVRRQAAQAAIGLLADKFLNTGSECV